MQVRLGDDTMILFFSGTGNARHVAMRLGQELSETVLDMGHTPPGVFPLLEGERLGIVAPIHAWMIPTFVVDWLKRSTFETKPDYVFLISVCGAEEGEATSSMKRMLAKRGLNLKASFSIAMPNNYMLGYELDSPEEANRILEAADKRLVEILVSLKNKESRFDLAKGKMAKFKTSFVHPMFERFAMSSKPFYATDACIRCGRCVDNCPVHTITMKDLPVWGKECTQCLACINRCPVQAIEYGKSTIGKRRYVHPDLKEDM
jgi:ferredoxin